MYKVLEFHQGGVACCDPLSEILDLLQCPISYGLLTDPVSLPGEDHLYERHCLEQWFKHQSELSGSSRSVLTSPITRKKIPKRCLLHEHKELRALLTFYQTHSFLERYPHLRRLKLDHSTSKAFVDQLRLLWESFGWEGSVSHSFQFYEDYVRVSCADQSSFRVTVAQLEGIGIRSHPKCLTSVDIIKLRHSTSFNDALGQVADRYHKDDISDESCMLFKSVSYRVSRPLFRVKIKNTTERILIQFFEGEERGPYVRFYRLPSSKQNLHSSVSLASFCSEDNCMGEVQFQNIYYQKTLKQLDQSFSCPHCP